MSKFKSWLWRYEIEREWDLIPYRFVPFKWLAILLCPSAGYVIDGYSGKIIYEK